MISFNFSPLIYLLQSLTLSFPSVYPFIFPNAERLTLTLTLAFTRHTSRMIIDPHTRARPHRGLSAVPVANGTNRANLGLDGLQFGGL